jgi:uncharacterized protein with LGFP repeats
LCSQTFQLGSIYVFNNGAPYAVYGPENTKFVASGGVTGALGYPVGALVPITGPNGNGYSQAFSTGHILRSASGVFVISGMIRDTHNSLGWVRGKLGWPISDQTCSSATVCSQKFQGGTISLSAGTVSVTYK